MPLIRDFWSARRCLRPRGGYIPVSYTHLDVYKRQDQDAALIRRLMESHLKHTASPLARRLLAAFDPAAFVKAIPTAYRKAQEAYAAAAGEDEEARLLCAYEAVTA